MREYLIPRGVVAPFCASLAFAPLTVQGARVSGRGKHFDHVVVVVMENEGTSQALADPGIASLSRESAWLSNYHALAHPSLPNYLALVAGTTFGLTRDHVDTPLKAKSIVDRLEEKGLTWKSYAEDFPGACFLRGEAGARRLTPGAKPTAVYTKRHVPLLNFASVQTNARRCARVVNADQFLTDARLHRLPNYSFYSPNLFNDGHDTPLATASAWLQRFVHDFNSSAAAKDRTLLVIVWDEGGGREARTNGVLAMLFGDVVKPGRYGAQLTHYSLLRTIEDNFGLTPLAEGDSQATPLPNSIWAK
ncbi:MAG: alkaline phosphatase family protein [Gemmatimonadaceae bacterium]